MDKVDSKQSSKFSKRDLLKLVGSVAAGGALVTLFPWTRGLLETEVVTNGIAQETPPFFRR